METCSVLRGFYFEMFQQHVLYHYQIYSLGISEKDEEMDKQKHDSILTAR